MALAPIILGSPATSTFIFEVGSAITTSTSGIQECSVKALCANGATVFSSLPAAGATFNSVFGNSYLPNDFKVDYTTSGPQVEYLEGQVARVTFSFKRPDPLTTGPTASRQVFVDSTLNYKSVLSPIFYTGIAASGEAQEGIFGFPEPTVTVKYNTANPPALGGGDLTTLYALPGSTKVAGFPPIVDITVPYTFTVPGGSVVSWVENVTFHSTTVTVDTTFIFNFLFKANPRGWQITKLKYDPVAASSFYDVEENWRNFYFFFGTSFVSATPNPP